MARFVIDAPTLLRLVEEGKPVNPEHQLVAPALIRSQALSLLLTAVRRGEITEAVALERHERMTEMKMRLLNDRVSRRTAWRIAQEQGWETTLEAEYLAVTKLQADALVTVDPAMIAKAADLVATAPMSALSAVRTSLEVRIARPTPGTNRRSSRARTSGRGSSQLRFPRTGVKAESPIDESRSRESSQLKGSQGSPRAHETRQWRTHHDDHAR
jgi:predicted nucleic acid-binding protein